MCFLFFVLSLFHSLQILGSYSYQGPTQPVPGNPQLIRVEILIRDSPIEAGLKINSVKFDNKTVPLQPSDIYGNRGTASFQVPPGEYKLYWITQKDKNIWPRTTKNEKTIEINPAALWVQIEIIGSEVSIR